MKEIIRQQVARLKAVVYRGWSYGRIPVYLTLSLILAFFVGYFVCQLTGWTYGRLIALYRVLDHVVHGASMVSDSASVETGELYTGIAVGAAVILTWFRELLDSVAKLWPWDVATREQIRVATIAVFASGLGLFVSAFALGNSREPSSKELTVAFDGVTLPPITAVPRTGLVSFYIPFYEEASYGALATDGDPSISVSDDFKPFLEDLGGVLTNCAKKGSGGVEISVSGFASVSRWYAFASDTSSTTVPYVRNVLRLRYFDQWKAWPTDDVLASQMRRFEQSRAEVARLAEIERKLPPRSDTPWADAFNVWLAYKRRDAVIKALGLENGVGGVQLESRSWANYNAMSTALAIDDASTIARGTVGGLLSRSVRVTIVHAGACEREIARHSAALTIAPKAMR